MYNPFARAAPALQVCRYMSASEAIWAAMGYDMKYCTMGITRRLPVHLSGADFVVEATDPRDTRPETMQIESKLSLLDRYFFRPASSVFDLLTYGDYYNLYTVKKAAKRQLEIYDAATADEHGSGITRSTAAGGRKVMPWWVDVDGDRAPVGASAPNDDMQLEYDRFCVSQRRELHGTRIWSTS